MAHLEEAGAIVAPTPEVLGLFWRMCSCQCMSGESWPARGSGRSPGMTGPAQGGVREAGGAGAVGGAAGLGQRRGVLEPRGRRSGGSGGTGLCRKGEGESLSCRVTPWAKAVQKQSPGEPARVFPEKASGDRSGPRAEEGGPDCAQGLLSLTLAVLTGCSPEAEHNILAS